MLDRKNSRDIPDLLDLLGVRIRPARGRVVHFHNLHADGSPDERTLHAGLPVERGAKWLGTMWTRQRRLRDY